MKRHLCQLLCYLTNYSLSLFTVVFPKKIHVPIWHEEQNL